MLEHVAADDRVDAETAQLLARLLAQGERVGRDARARLVAKAAAEKLDRDGVEIRRDDELGGRTVCPGLEEVARDVPEAGADLEDPTPEHAAEAPDEPAVVRLELRHPLEGHVAHVIRVLRLAHAVLDDRPERGEGVLQADLLPFLVGPAVVRDRHLVDAVAAPRDLRGDLRLDPEPARFDRDRLDDLAAEHLVAGLHVGQVQVGEHVRRERQHPVPDRVPEVEDAALAASEEPRAVHDVGVSLLDRPEQLRVLARVVLEVRVLDDDDVAGRLLKTRRDRGALSHVLRLQEDPDAVLAVHLAQDVARAVLRAVVDDDDLLLDRHRLHLADELADRLRLVVDGDDDGELHRPASSGGRLIPRLVCGGCLRGGDPPPFEPVADEGRQRRGAIAQPDLLPLGPGAREVGDGHLEDAEPAARDLHRDLRVDPEAALLNDVERGNHSPVERLVAGRHVGQVQVRDDVRDQRQDTVADRMPEILDPVLRAAAETRSEHDVGSAGLDRPQEARVLGGVVLEVGVLDENDLPSRRGERRPQRAALAGIALVEDHSNSRAPVPARENFAGAVRRSVIHDHDLLLDGHLGDETEDLIDRTDLVVHGHQHGEFHGAR